MFLQKIHNYFIIFTLYIWECDKPNPPNFTEKRHMLQRIYLNLHLEVRLKVGEQSEENGEWEFEDLRHRGHSIFGQGHTQVLFDGIDEHLISLEDGPGVLQDGQEQLEGQDLRSQLMRPEEGDEKTAYNTALTLESF